MDAACVTRNSQLAGRVVQALSDVADLRLHLYSGVAALVRAARYHDLVLITDDADQLGAFLMYRRDVAGAWATSTFVLCSHDGGVELEQAVDAGIDDFVTLPHGMEQLAARVRLCMLRRGSSASVQSITLGGVTLHADDGTATRRGEPVHLTRREFDLAWALALRQGRLVSFSVLAEACWGADVDIAKRSIEQHAYRVRRKLGLDGSAGLRLSAVYGRGYRIERLAPPARSPAALPICA
jgi:DNA-binding response OmpR family regulator